MVFTKPAPGKAADAHDGRRRLAGRIRRYPIRLLLPLLLSLLAVLAIAYAHRAATGDDAYRAALHEREHLAMTMVAAAATAGAGLPAAATALQSLVAEAIALPKLPLVALGIDVGGDRYGGLAAGEKRLSDAWRRVNVGVEQLIAAKSSVEELRSAVALFQSLAGRLLVATDELVDVVIEREDSPRYVYLVTRQMMLLQRIQTNLHRVLEGGSGVLVAADRIGRDAVLFGDVVNGLLHDNPDIGLSRVADEEVRATLEDLGRQFREAAALIESIIEQADAVQRQRRAIREIEGAGKAVAIEARELRRLHRTYVDARIPSLFHVGVLLVLAIFALAVTTIAMVRDSRRIVKRAEMDRDELHRLEAEVQSANERADEVQGQLHYIGQSVLQVAEGGAPAQAPEHEDLEDPATEIVAALRESLTAFDQRTKNVAREVARTVGALREHVRRLEKIGAHQARQVRAVVGAVEEVAQATGKTPAEVVELMETTRALIDDGRSGGELLGETGSDLERMRESINETAQAARRVVERSQQLREVSTRIEELSDYSRMLSLNVTLQASGGVDGARAISNFADELERLAERSRVILPSIENVAEGVRNEAEDTAKSVKQTLWVLASAGERVRKAASTFDATVRFGRRIEALLESLASANQKQGMQGLHAVRATTELATLLNQTRGAVEVAASGANRLAQMVEQLESSLVRKPAGPEPIAAVVALDEVTALESAPKPQARQAATD